MEHGFNMNDKNFSLMKNWKEIYEHVNKKHGGNMDHFAKYIAIYSTIYVLIMCGVVYMITQI